MSYQLLPFRFSECDDKYFLTNYVGDYLYLGGNEFRALLAGKIEEGSLLFRELQAKLIISSGNLNFDLNVLSSRYRSKKAFVEDGPVLHMVVTTLRCNQQCRYCQASAHDKEDQNLDLTEELAKKTARIIMQSKSDCIKVEFQGGEPTLNFDAIKTVVSEIENLNIVFKKNVSYVVCTNLYNISAEQLDFYKEMNFDISTSIDGPEYLHDLNRISWKKTGTFNEVKQNIERARNYIGDRVNALLTISRQNLNHLTEVIDTYIELGFKGITLRPLNPYGRCVQNKQDLSYSIDEYVEAYEKAIRYIISLGKKGIQIKEGYSTLLLRRMLTPFPTGFVDLQSPCGAGLSCVIYNYNGNVYACDEGRMLSEMGDETFCLGKVSDSYEKIFTGEVAKKLLTNSIVDSIPECSTCPFAMWCGADPVRNYATSGHFIALKYKSEFCMRHKKLFILLLSLLSEDNETFKLLHRWAWSCEV